MHSPLPTHTDDGVHQGLDLRGLHQLQGSQGSVQMLLGFVTGGVLCETLDTVIELQIIMLLVCYQYKYYYEHHEQNMLLFKIACNRPLQGVKEGYFNDILSYMLSSICKVKQETTFHIQYLSKSSVNLQVLGINDILDKLDVICPHSHPGIFYGV